MENYFRYKKLESSIHETRQKYKALNVKTLQKKDEIITSSTVIKPAEIINDKPIKILKTSKQKTPKNYYLKEYENYTIS